MAKRDEFDPNEILDDVTAASEDDFDILGNLPELQDSEEDEILNDLLGQDFLSMLGYEDEEAPKAGEISENQEDILSEAAEIPVSENDEDVKTYAVTATPAFDVEPELDEEFFKSVEEIFPDTEDEETHQPVVPVVDMNQEEQPAAPARRRKKMSRERIIKEVYLPPAILVLTLILLVSFIGTAIGRSIKEKRQQEAAVQSSQQAASSALAREAELLIAQADVLAKGYDYDSAIALLDSFEGDKSQFQGMLDAYNTYTQAKAQLKPIDAPNSIPNLSFHCLIVDPARAFSDKDWGKSYNENYVTIDEFSKILDQLYTGGYVLVDFNSFIQEAIGEDGKVTYSTQPIYLPEGKKPIMITETLVNYELFTIDSDGDLEADKGGDGFASKLLIKDGKIVNEYVDADGNVHYGAYDLVPILEEFIAAHPDFCYRGARATLAVSGEDGVFGYRIMHSVKEKKGEDYYNQQVEGAKTIAQALRDRGYTIACYTYANVDYGKISATKIQVDLDNWKKEVTPVLGEVPFMIFAKSSDGNYVDAKYNVLKNEGFRYFISAAKVPYAEITVNAVRQSRIMVTGKEMITKPDTFASYFTAKDVLNEQRGK